MWQWLANVTGWGILNIGGDVTRWVRDLIHGVFGWLTSAFGHVGDAWHDIFGSASAIWLSVEHFGLANLAVLWHIINKQIPRVFEWAFNHFKQLLDFANRIWRDLNLWVKQLIARIEQAVANALKWVRDHVWVPLKAFIDGILKWIHDRGEVLWFYITHPDKLASLIFDALIALLERTAWDVGGKLGKFFLALIIHNLRHFVSLIEDILMAVL